jgi:glycosyltransferase involved in cell wall biosynthesis
LGAGRISVVIPLYNHERYIEQTLDSVFRQTRPVYEVVVVNDGSRDGSAAVVERLCARQPRLVFWSQPNRGAHAAINAGIHRTTGDVVAILNSDDLYHPTRFAEMMAVLEERPDIDALFTGLDFIDDDGRAIPNAWYGQATDFHRRSGDLALTLINGNIVMTTSNLLVRRNVFDEVGHFSPLRYAHDLDFFLRLLVRGKTLHRLDTPLMSYRMHATNTINEGHMKVKAEWAAVTAFFLDRLWGGQPVDWERAGRILDVLDRHALTRPVQLCAAYFRNHPTDTFELNPFHADTAFHRVLNGSLQ